jgi:hypothetical protein
MGKKRSKKKLYHFKSKLNTFKVRKIRIPPTRMLKIEFIPDITIHVPQMFSIFLFFLEK